MTEINKRAWTRTRLVIFETDEESGSRSVFDIIEVFDRKTFAGLRTFLCRSLKGNTQKELRDHYVWMFEEIESGRFTYIVEKDFL